MTLTEMKNQTIADLLEKMEMVNFIVHSDPKGNICSIEIEYEPTKERTEGPWN